MKATMEIPDDLYRRVKAKSALEGRAVREVAIELFHHYVDRDAPAPTDEPVGRTVVDGVPAPRWFGALRDAARRVDRHDIDEIRRSVARGIRAERL